jgi:hypothetical protein
LFSGSGACRPLRDASVIHGGVSQVWTRHLTNHGIFGAGLLFLGAAFICGAAVRQSAGAITWVLLFLTLFWLSFYQRPVIWLPYFTLILIAGLASARLDDATR